ncbi:MAG: transferase [Kiritimatiellae bacterium]|nr:transferase [Kiritimatiellia bacterium]
MTRDIMIVGAGGWGREVAWTLERINAYGGPAPTWNILGVADDDPAKGKGKGSMEGYPYLGTPEEASHDYPGAKVIIAIGDNAVREKIYRRLRGHDFPAIIDPSAVVAPTVDLRHGVYVGALAVISVGCNIGKFVIVNTRAGVGHDCTVDDFAQLCPGATMSGHSFLGAHGYMATNSCLVPNVKVGAHAQIAAGTPVFADVREGETLSPFGTLKA